MDLGRIIDDDDKQAVGLVLDDCFRLLLKATRYDLFVEKMKRALSDTSANNIRASVFAFLEQLNLVDGRITDADMDKIEPLINQRLGEDLAKEVEKDLEKLTQNLYNESVRFKGAEIKLQGNVNFSLPDSRAIEQLQKANMVWIKGNDLRSQVADDLTKEMIKARKLGLTRSQAAVVLERQFGPLVPKDIAEKYGTSRYWDGFVRQHATRTRVFADLDTYKAAGIKRYQIWSRLSERTCEICGRLHGTVHLVADAEKAKEQFFRAAQNGDVDGMKKATPWVYTPPDHNATPALSLPPLHFNCECHTRTFREKFGKSDSAIGKVNLSENGKKVKFTNNLIPDDALAKNRVITRTVEYSVVDKFSKNIYVTKEAVEHCKIRISENDHKRFGEKDADGYKYINAALADPECMISQGKQRLIYIGKNGYVVSVHENQVWSAYFGDYSKPKTVKEAILNTKAFVLTGKKARLL